MPRYGVMVREGSNRVYAASAPEMLVAEVAAIAPAFHAAFREIERSTIGDVPYVVIDADEFDHHDRFIASNLSGGRALFELRDDGSLLPLPLQTLEYYDDDLISIQRYPGKTNEQFTHLLVNLTVAASRSAHERAAADQTVRVLDPVAGRGTTLNRALMYGFDAAGIEVAEADVDQYRSFITTYLKDHRVKHRVQRERIRKGPLAGTSQFWVTIRGGQEVRLVRGESADAAELVAGRKFDVIVGDLPYGVQHRAAASAVNARSPGSLLAESAAGWRRILAGGGALGLSWNAHTLDRATVIDLLVDAGFTPVDHPYPFEHVVDRSITRDLIVATR